MAASPKAPSSPYPRLPGQSTSTDSLWSDPSWLDEPSQETPWLAPERYASVATRTQLQIPIESLPIGARVPTKNPNRSEVDPQPEPDHATWAKISITAEGSDGGIVDAEIIRPRSWILASGLCAGRMLPLNLPELEVSGLALVTAIDDCPPIAGGEGSVVTARFVTREVHVVASVDVLGADGTVETITATTIHPVWSVDRQEWVPLAELADSERLCCDTESFGLGFPSGVAPGAWHRFGPLFASVRPGVAPGAWHRFGPLFASIRPGVAPGAWHRFG